MESQLGEVAPRRNEMCSAERGQEIVKRDFVRDIDRREAKTPFVFFTFEEIVISHREVKQVTWRYAGRIMIIILCSGGRDRDSR